MPVSGTFQQFTPQGIISYLSYYDLVEDFNCLCHLNVQNPQNASIYKFVQTNSAWQGLTRRQFSLGKLFIYILNTRGISTDSHDLLAGL